MSELPLTSALEAILFASPAPVSCSRAATVLGVSEQEVRDAMEALAASCREDARGIELVCKTDGYRFITKKIHAPVVAAYLATRRPTLSNAAMETLAIAAYNQPVTKTYISQIRGVSSSEIVDALVEKGLLEENGKLDLPGRPMSFVTTDIFLTVFGLDSLKNLPEADFASEDIEMELPPVNA